MFIYGVALLAALPSLADTIITENVTLDADADWRDQGQVTIASDVTVDLNGHKLRVKGLACNGSIVDSSAVEGYQRITYLEASRQQWIDTGFVPTASTAVEMDFTTTDDNDNRAYFCATWGDNGYMLVVNQGYFRFYGSGGGNLLQYAPNTHYRFATLPGQDPNVAMYDGESGALLGSYTKNLSNKNGYTMSIFAGNNNGTRFQLSQYRLHSFKMTNTDDGTVVRDMVPVVRESDGEAGMYDLANGAFYGNSGSGVFIKGPIRRPLVLDLSDGATYSFDGTCAVPMAVGDSALSQDCDLRAFGTVEIDGNVALNGHRLLVAGATGTGTILNQAGMYSHYRFKVEAIGSGAILAFSDLRLYSYGVNVTMQRSGASGSYGGGSASNGQTYLAALDNSVDNKLCVTKITNFNTLWVQVDYAEPIMITKYEWYSTNDGDQRQRSPTKWRFQGSNDGTNWVDIDVVERAYDENPATSKTLAYTYDNGLAQVPEPGEFHVDVPQGNTAENAVALAGDVKFVKDGAGMLTETRTAQSHTGGDEITAGTMAYAAANYVLPGDLTLAGGTLAITDGMPLAVSGAVYVTSPSTLKFISDVPFGRKLLISGSGTGFDIDDLTLDVEPSNPGTGNFSFDGDDLYVAFGAADDVMLAHWTGAVDGDVSKPENWNCYNALGTLLEGKLPAETTDVRIGGNVNIQMPVGTTIAHASFIIGDCTLMTDCDWRGHPGSIDGTVTLGGHRLVLADFLGAGTIKGDQGGGYLHYRFKVEAIGSGTVLGFSDLRLYSHDVNVTGNRSGASGSNGGGRTSNSETFAAVLDNNVNNKWCPVEITDFDTLWVQVDYAAPIMITKYEWYSTNDGAQRDRAPTKWRFQGSNDGTNWEDLDVMERAYGANPATSKTLAYTGRMAPSTPASDVLQVDVGEGLTKTNSTFMISGNVKVVKTGAGTFIANKAGQMYNGGTEVAEGTLKPGVNSAAVFGEGGDTIVVADGAQILDDLAANEAFDRHYLQLEGEGPDGTGAYRVTTYRSYANNYAWTRGLTVTGDTLFGRDDYGFGLIKDRYDQLPLKLNGHTLTFRSPKTVQNATHLGFAGVKGVGPGTLVISDYVKLYPMREHESVLPEVTLVIEPLAEYWTGSDSVGQALTVSNLVYRSSSGNSQTAHTTTVLGCYTPASTTSAPKVQLGDAEHLSVGLDLSERTTEFDVSFGGGFTFTEGACVKVNLGTRRRSQSERLVAWTEKPVGVTFTGETLCDRFSVCNDGLYLARGTLIIIR